MNIVFSVMAVLSAGIVAYILTKIGAKKNGEFVYRGLRLAKKGCRWTGNIGKSSRDRERRILELMFPSRFKKWFDMNRSNLPLVRGPETDIAAQRFFRIRMDRERR